MPAVDKNLVQNQVVTRATNGYKQAGLIWNQVAPEIKVDSESIKLLEFGNEHFKLYDTSRPMNSDIRTAQTDPWTYTDADLVEHSFGFDLDERKIRNGSNYQNMVRAYAKRVAQSLELEKEKTVADMVFNTSTITQNTTLSGSNQWSDKDDSDPIANIHTAISTVRSSIGTDPNTLVLGDAVFKALKNNNAITDRLKYTSKLLTPAILAEMFDLEKVIIGKSVYDNDGTMTDLWGKHALVAYVPKSPAVEEPALAYTYSLKGGKKGYLYNANNSGKVKTVAADDFYLNKVVWANAGYLIEDASA